MNSALGCTGFHESWYEHHATGGQLLTHCQNTNIWAMLICDMGGTVMPFSVGSLNFVQ